MATLGIDFGTSNTAAAVIESGRPRILELEPGRDVLPTAVFLDFSARRTVYGSQAVQSMIDGQDGRFMRALKSILGTPLARERRQFLNEKLTMIEIIGRFLGEIRSRAGAATGAQFDRAVSGRPVHFHSRAPERDAQALEDLRAAYELAGFAEVSFLPEPEAAALASGGEGLSLIVDIGGGTSDFTLFRDQEIIASHGVRIGGTDFDRALSLAHVMPLLGMGAGIGKEFGAGLHPAPKALFLDLASWEKIPFVYGDATLREVRRWEKLAQEPVLFARLGEVLESHLGHDVAFAVEDGKIAANGGAAGQIDLSLVERGLAAALTPDDLLRDLADYRAGIREAAEETLERAGCAQTAVDRVVFVGGSSLMGVVRDEMTDLMPGARQEVSEVFTAVADGLAIAAGREDGLV
ncbi:MAG: hsp70 family protein [Rhodobacterales bacterium]|nr:MAG: hsp70 family protein [Rhodobacterales bacterium]